MPGLLFLKYPGVVKLCQPLLDRWVVSEVVIHARDVLEKTEQWAQAVNPLKEGAEQVPRVSMPEPCTIDIAVGLAWGTCNLDGRSCTLVPVLAVSHISCDQLGMLREGSIGPDGVDTEWVVVLKMHHSEAQGCPSLR